MLKFAYKIYAIAFLLFVLVFFTVSCKKSPAEMSAKSISEAISAEIALPKLVQIDEKQLSNHFNLSAEDFSDFEVFMAESEEKADEYAVFELKDKVAESDVFNAISVHIANRTNSFKQLPSEYAKLQNNVLRSKDNFVVFIVTEENKKASELLEEMGISGIAVSQKNKP